MSNRALIPLLIAQTALVVGACLAIRSGALPTGVRGEWEWLRIAARPDPFALGIAGASILALAGLAMAGSRAIDRGGRPWGWLVALGAAAIVVQGAVQEGAPPGFGLAKWSIALASPGSSGYYTIAREIDDLPGFLRAYPGWIARGDSLHVGTHPPGLFVANWATLRFFRDRPGLARAFLGLLPGTAGEGFRAMVPPVPLPDRASLAAIGALTMIACALTVVPLFFLARIYVESASAWATASLWPLVPAAILFQPTADAAFPLASTTAIALAVAAGRRRWLGVFSGLVLAIGCQFTLAFFPVGLVAGLALAARGEGSFRRRATAIGLIGVGFLLGTAALAWAGGFDPIAIWRANASNHARFYVGYPRSYRAWVLANPIELSIAIGLPIAVWGPLGLRSAPGVAMATLGTLAFLTVSGKNLSEVARLWLPLMPPLLVLAGAGIDRVRSRPIAIGTVVVLLGLQALILESTIQVVYPI